MKRTSVAMTAAVLTALATPLTAQTGLHVGAQVTDASLSYTDAAGKLDFRSGFGVRAGIGLGSMLVLVAICDKNTPGSSAEPWGDCGFSGVNPRAHLAPDLHHG